MSSEEESSLVSSSDEVSSSDGSSESGRESSALSETTNKTTKVAALRKRLYAWTCAICLSTQSIDFMTGNVPSPSAGLMEESADAGASAWSPLLAEITSYCEELFHRYTINMILHHIARLYESRIQHLRARREHVARVSAAVSFSRRVAEESLVSSLQSSPDVSIRLDADITTKTHDNLHLHVQKDANDAAAEVNIVVSPTESLDEEAAGRLQQELYAVWLRLRDLSATAAAQLLQLNPQFLDEEVELESDQLNVNVQLEDVEPPVIPESLLHEQVCPDCGTPYTRPSFRAVIGPGEVKEAEMLFETDAEGNAHRDIRSFHAIPIAEAYKADFVVNEDLLKATLKVAVPQFNDGKGAFEFVSTYLHRHGYTPDLITSVLTEAAARKQVAQSRPRVAVVYENRMLLHEEAGKFDPTSARAYLVKHLPPRPPIYHPERPDRLRAIAQHLVSTGLLQRCVQVAPRECHRHELEGVHDREYLDTIDTLDKIVAEHGGNFHLGSDTYACAHTLAAARLACGSTIAVTESVARGETDRAIALVRPPGHHAEANLAMGFCFFNNVAVAAWCAVHLWGLKRVLILDWDVHHGNGTENMFYKDPSVLYVSLHRYDNGSFYPGTGSPDHIGAEAGRGYNINIPWPRGKMGDAEYMAAFDEVIMPVAAAYDPELVLVSCGFDAARGDPLGGCDLTPAGYAHMTHRLLSLAGGRMVVVLEGGYNLRSISRSMEAVTRVLLGESPPTLVPLPARTHSGPVVEKSSLANRAEALLRETEKFVRPTMTTNGVTAHISHETEAHCFHTSEADKEAIEEEFAEISTREEILLAATPRYDAMCAIYDVMKRLAGVWPQLNAKAAAAQQVLLGVQTEEGEEASSGDEVQDGDAEESDSPADSSSVQSDEEPAAKRPRKRSNAGSDA